MFLCTIKDQLDNYYTHILNKKIIHIDQYLVTKLKAGDERAFNELFNRYQNDIFIYAQSLVKSGVHAQEVVQEVFVKVWLKKATLKPDLSFKSFLFTIAKNISFNFLVKAANERRLHQEVFYRAVTSYSPIEDLIRTKEYELLKQQAINRLPPKRKRIFEMSRNEGKSYQDISCELGITKQTVKNQMSHALANITGYLKSYGEITLRLTLLLFIM